MADTPRPNIRYPASSDEQAAINEGLDALHAYDADAKSDPEVWIRVGTALRLIQMIAEKAGGSRSGGGFNKHWRSAVAEHGFQKIEASERSRIIRLMQEAERVREWWHDLSDQDRRRWRNPSTMWRHYEEHAISKGWLQAKNRRASSSSSNLKQQLMEKDRENAQLREKLAKAEARDGSRFDLNRDSAENIGKTIIGSIGESKARKIAKVIEEGLQARRQTQSKESKPAG
jgi:hypothetical protein